MAGGEEAFVHLKGRSNVNQMGFTAHTQIRSQVFCFTLLAVSLWGYQRTIRQQTEGQREQIIAGNCLRISRVCFTELTEQLFCYHSIILSDTVFSITGEDTIPSLTAHLYQTGSPGFHGCVQTWGPRAALFTTET